MSRNEPITVEAAFWVHSGNDDKSSVEFTMSDGNVFSVQLSKDFIEIHPEKMSKPVLKFIDSYVKGDITIDEVRQFIAPRIDPETSDVINKIDRRISDLMEILINANSTEEETDADSDYIEPIYFDMPNGTEELQVVEFVKAAMRLGVPFTVSVRNNWGVKEKRNA